MPRYEFKCEICNDVKEITATFQEGYIVPNCDDPDHGKMMRIFSAAHVQFTGSGFYSTDKDKK
jgi:putative FmdB family regulatory protein